MRLVITQNITVDGVIEQDDDTGEWFTVDGHDTGDVEEVMRTFMAEETAQLHGRLTFEAMRGFWPLQQDDTTGVTAHLNRVHKYVASNTMTDPAWDHSTILTGDLLDEVRRLKERPGGTLGVTGSVSVCHALITGGLVDEYRLLVYPIVVGTGRRLFDTAVGEPRRLVLLGTRASTSGITLLRYAPVDADAP